MKSILLFFVLASLTIAGSGGNEVHDNSIGLKDIVSDKFLMGAAVNTYQASGKDTASVRVLKKHFNSIVAENCMKSAEMQPVEGCFDFSRSDEFVQFGQENNMSVIGHCLIWHSQCPEWFFEDENGGTVSPETLKKRMKIHISTIVGRYKGKIKGWDVVNEAFLDNGMYRESKFYQILGEEFIPLAFQYAHEADPDAELYYNDYNMSSKWRRKAVVKMIGNLKSRGIRIDAVGMQGHMGMDYPGIDDFEKSILAFGEAGVKVMVTEWDMSALPTLDTSANITDTVAFSSILNPYPDVLPDSVANVWNARMKQFFNLFEKHSDIVSRVTVWGITDSDSWKNNFPVRGRKDYPLLFDRNYRPKKFVSELIENYNLNNK